MGDRRRLGKRALIGAALLPALLFGGAGQPANLAAAGSSSPVVSISGSPDVSEGLPATFTATINPAAAVNFTVTYTASAGGLSGSFPVTAGQTSVDFQVATVDDGVYQSSPRQFTVTLSTTNASDGTTVDGTPATGTLENVDPPPASVVSIGDASGAVVEGNSAQFPVNVSPAASVAFDVSYTATGGGVGGSFHVDQGATSLSLPVATVDDGAPQDDRAMTVTLTGTNSTNGSSVDGTPGTGTIVDNDWTITLTPINPPAVSEQGGTIQFAAHLNAAAPAHHAISVDFSVDDGSAVRGTNYTVDQAGGTLNFAPGDSTATVTVTGKDDGVYSAGAAKTFTFSLSNPQGATILGSSSSTGTINDAPALWIADGSAPERSGAIPLVVRLTPPAIAPVTVDYYTVDGSGPQGAREGTDYTAESGTLTFAPGETTKTISIPITPYSFLQPDKSFQVALSNANGIAIARGTAFAMILNDNAPIALPPIARGLAPKQTTPQAIPMQHKITDLVLVQMLTGNSRANASGQAGYRISCPEVVIQLCSGTVVFDVRVLTKVPKGSKRKPGLTNLRVGSGAFSVHSGKTGTVVVNLTKPGLKLLLTVKRLRVKATIRAKDGFGVKGVTAWYVSIAAPLRKTTTTKKHAVTAK